VRRRLGGDRVRRRRSGRRRAPDLRCHRGVLRRPDRDLYRRRRWRPDVRDHLDPGGSMSRALTIGLVLGLAARAAAAEPPAPAPAVPAASEGTATEPIPPPPAPVTPPLYQATVVGQRPDPALFGASGTTVTRERLEALPGGDTQPITEFVSM